MELVTVLIFAAMIANNNATVAPNVSCDGLLNGLGNFEACATGFESHTINCDHTTCQTEDTITLRDGNAFSYRARHHAQPADFGNDCGGINGEIRDSPMDCADGEPCMILRTITSDEDGTDCSYLFPTTAMKEDW